MHHEHNRVLLPHVIVEKSREPEASFRCCVFSLKSPMHVLVLKTTFTATSFVSSFVVKWCSIDFHPRHQWYDKTGYHWQSVLGFPSRYQ
jgi:hypothetical protein